MKVRKNSNSIDVYGPENMQNEQRDIMCNKNMTILVLIEYVRTSVEVLMDMKLDELVKHKKKVENKKL